MTLGKRTAVGQPLDVQAIQAKEREEEEDNKGDDEEQEKERVFDTRSWHGYETLLYLCSRSLWRLHSAFSVTFHHLRILAVQPHQISLTTFYSLTRRGGEIGEV